VAAASLWIQILCDIVSTKRFYVTLSGGPWGSCGPFVGRLAVLPVSGGERLFIENNAVLMVLAFSASPSCGRLLQGLVPGLWGYWRECVGSGPIQLPEGGVVNNLNCLFLIM
jgi:hypothetical protein